jgi:hypothetical protein
MVWVLRFVDTTSRQRAETKMPPGLAASRFDGRVETGRLSQARHQQLSVIGFVSMNGV